MLKFFRKIRQALLKEGKTKEYLKYALGETLLVMIGILLALQVNNWNDDRVNKRKERLLLREVYAEFLLNKEELEDKIARYEQVKDQCVNIASLFPIHPDSVNIEWLAPNFNDISFIGTFDVFRGSIATLENSASFDIISDSELRTLLIRFDDLVADYANKEHASVQFCQQFFIPYLDRRIPRPYQEGIMESRVDLSFLSSIEFENLIQKRIETIESFFRLLEDEHRNPVKAINRIIELSEAK